MNTTFIQINNHIIQLEKICRAEYKKFDAEDSKLLGAGSILYLGIADGTEIKLKDTAAEQMWECLKDSSLNITPIKSAVDDQ